MVKFLLCKLKIAVQFCLLPIFRAYSLMVKLTTHNGLVISSNLIKLKFFTSYLLNNEI